MRFNATMFLESLFREPADHVAIITPADLPVDWWVLWDELAAIREYDGGCPRERAEALALTDVLKAMDRAGVRLAKLK